MTPLRWALALLAILSALALTFWAGYELGVAAQGPDHRALMVVRRGPGDSVGTSATWFDIRNPADAARLRAEEKRLKSLGVEHYVTKGIVERTLSPAPDPRRVNSHR